MLNFSWDRLHCASACSNRAQRCSTSLGKPATLHFSACSSQHRSSLRGVTPQAARNNAKVLHAHTRAAAAAEGNEEEGDAAAAAPPGGASVFKLVCVRERPRPDLPLLLGSVSSATRCACAVTYKGQLHLLTAASVVAYGTQLLVSVPGVDKPFKARIHQLGVECELALLRVDDPTFWKHAAPLELGALPEVQDAVRILGPQAPGGTSSRSVAGTVACVEVVGYPSSLQRLLGLQLSATIAADQAGGAPVVCGSSSACVGIVFRRERRGRSNGGMRAALARGGHSGTVDHTAFAVPSEMVARFLDAVASPAGYVGLPSLGVRWKQLEAAPLRRFLGMQPHQQGILILDVNATSNAAMHLRPDDVLLSFNGQPVGNDGTVAFGSRAAQRISLIYAVTQLQVGAAAVLMVLRGGQELQLDFRLNVPQRLLPTHLAGKQPSYLVLSGLVFTRASVPYLEAAFGGSWARAAPVHLLNALNLTPAARGGEELVVVAHCEDVPAVEGYSAAQAVHSRVTHFDGVPVTSLRQLAQAVLSSKGDTLTFELNRGRPATVMVLPAAQARADTRTMLAQYQVEHAVSDDLKDLLPQRKAVGARRVLRH